MLNRVLAIDGALNKSGWVILDEKETKSGELKISGSKYGTIAPKSTMSLAFKLLYIRKELLNLIKTYKPDVIVLEDVYLGPNVKTGARLNNAKGVYVLTAYEATGKEPVYVAANVARSCLGFKNNKEEPYKYFSELFNLKESFNKGNDITDAYTLGFWYIKNRRGECVVKKNKKSGKKNGRKSR